MQNIADLEGTTLGTVEQEFPNSDAACVPASGRRRALASQGRLVTSLPPPSWRWLGILGVIKSG